MLPADFWNDLCAQTHSYSSADTPADELCFPSQHPVTNLPKPHAFSETYENDLKMHRNPGEASWTSFFRLPLWIYGRGLVYEFVHRDADRCPSDLPTAPMPISVRDVIVLGFATGMKCTSASFHDQTLFMNGPTGSLTSSRHPVLGPLLHFNPQSLEATAQQLDRLLNLGLFGHLSMEWAMRMVDIVTVAKASYDVKGRRALQSVASRWVPRYRATSHENKQAPSADGHDKSARRGPAGLSDLFSFDVNEADQDKRKARAEQRLNGVSEDSKVHGTFEARPEMIPRGPHDGFWTLRDQPLTTPRPGPPAGSGTPAIARRKSSHSSRSQPVQHTGLETLDRERWQTSINRQATRAEKVREAVADEIIIKAAVDRGDTPPIPVLGKTMLLLKEKGEPPEDEQNEDPAIREAAERERARHEARNQREKERTDRLRLAGDDVLKYRDVDWFWMSQMNITPGYWVAPWTHPKRQDFKFDQADCVGAIAVAFEALLGLLSKESIQFVSNNSGWPSGRSDLVERGKSTWPAYAENARGGVVCSGLYRTVNHAAFATPLPVLTLYGDYKTQVETVRDRTDKRLESAMLELTSIDAWLSLTGRMREIADGRNMLLKQTPAMVAIIFGEYQLDFSYLYLSAEEGGYADIQAVTATVMDFMAVEELSDAEMIYILVAMLRTAKVGQCILHGADSEIVSNFIRHDIQAHLV